MKIEHVTINVSDLEASIAFYQTVLGLTIQQDLRAFGSPIVFLAEDKGDAKIELIEAKEKPYSGSGISIGFGVADAESRHAELKAAGLVVSDIISPSPVTKFFFVSDPDGVKVQLIESVHSGRE